MRSARRALLSFSASFASRGRGPAILLRRTSSSAASCLRSAHNLDRCASKSRAVVSRASQSACLVTRTLGGSLTAQALQIAERLPLLLDDWGGCPMKHSTRPWSAADFPSVIAPGTISPLGRRRAVGDDHAAAAEDAQCPTGRECGSRRQIRTFHLVLWPSEIRT